MKKENLAIAARFLPGAALAIKIAIDRMVITGGIENTYLAEALSKTLPFLLPLIPFAIAAGKDNIKKYAGKGFSRKAIWYVIFMSLMTASLSFLINAAVSAVSFADGSRIVPSALAHTSYPSVVIPIVLVLGSAVLAEFFFRGCLTGAMEGYGAITALFIASAGYAMVCGEIYTALGMFASGLLYGYLRTALGSILPAIIAHLINSVYYIFLAYWGTAFEALGFWQHFVFVNILLFCMFLYIAMRQMDKMLEKGRLERLRFRGMKKTLRGILVSPGIWLLFIVYIINNVYNS